MYALSDLDSTAVDCCDFRRFMVVVRSSRGWVSFVKGSDPKNGALYASVSHAFIQSTVFWLASIYDHLCLSPFVAVSCSLAYGRSSLSVSSPSSVLLAETVVRSLIIVGPSLH